MSGQSTRILDHIIHLTPPGSLAETVKQFRSIGFTVVPGGTHADGLTANALVLSDGVYLELISFTHTVEYYPPSSPDRSKRESHWWASKHPGWIDFSHLATSNDISEIINDRGRKEFTNVVYQPAAAGGRERPDGKMLKWHVTFPDVKHGRGFLPFFCGDDTPREWRVPSEPASNTEHPSTAQGIAHVRLLVEPELFHKLSDQLTSVLGTQPIGGGTEMCWELQTPNSVRTPSRTTKLILGPPRDDIEVESLRTKGRGIYEVAFWVIVRDEKKSADTPFGRVVWLPVK
ncbi:hypothetical protein BD410DRAFT_726121 [Rickenella mellea]|uniref:Glyoxalase-like domain-containing protein n=1 Tax=Rickenella mellea TaxID=50990 RepID=A0A4Y7PYS0_9AGAM|nr:hypothetical protein BD410DRAFT_726121 [Rickenella mellea]